MAPPHSDTAAMAANSQFCYIPNEVVLNESVLDLVLDIDFIILNTELDIIPKYTSMLIVNKHINTEVVNSFLLIPVNIASLVFELLY